MSVLVIVFGTVLAWSIGHLRSVHLDHSGPKTDGLVSYGAKVVTIVKNDADSSGALPSELTDADDWTTHDSYARDRVVLGGRTTEYLMTVQSCANKYDVFRTVDTNPDDGVDYSKPMFFRQISGDATDGPGPDGHCAPREFLNEREVDTSIVMPDGTRLSGVKFRTRPRRTSNGSAVCGVIEFDPYGSYQRGESVCWNSDR